MVTTEHRAHLATTNRLHIGPVVAGSLLTGLLVAVFLVLAPFVPPEEHVVTGVTLLGFAVGWAALALLSTRLTLQPQRWAWAPAAYMAASVAVVLLAPGTTLERAAAWVWPPVLLVLVVWMFLRSRRDLISATRPWLLYPVFTVLLVLALGGGYEAVSSARDVSAAVPGRLVDVGDHRLHLSCTGSGSPTVVLEPGAGLMSAEMGWVAPAVARDTTVCVYDRAGRGWSDPAPTPPDGAQTATDLRTALHRAHVPGPYVLAGHSFGGLYVMSFAAQYPREVAGLVLIDSTAPSSAPVPPESTGYDLAGRVAAIAAATTRVGVGHLLAQTSYADLPPGSRDVARASASTADHVAGTVEEYAVGSRSTSQAGRLDDLGDRPLVVLTAGVGSDAEWIADQDELATLSTNSLHRVVAGASHGTLLEDPVAAAAVSKAVQDVVESVRTSSPLPRR
ncbi:alpha/beta hydrolase [Nocardioides iriomotensis]|uniref:Alpha/beta hydrolase n=1 Tax=Nocardioides iriomotensis TaxID=715784 RepID=A0A4V1Z136_9ACTN|nr:alpha/beta hydrolase [Nocardioides iriomotensis]RYU09536.1 alpha/beta hydrolase [Nocardioides iriomotensis]